MFGVKHRLDAFSLCHLAFSNVYRPIKQSRLLSKIAIGKQSGIWIESVVEAEQKHCGKLTAEAEH